jgi:protein-S-isoprenylcysteine O-methyltransferase Ste14
MTWRSILAFVAILPAAATFYFFIFWRWFDLWRKHRVLTFLVLIGSIVAVPVLVGGPGGWAFAERIRFPAAVQIVGWFLVALATVLGTIADRQIGLRVRLFMPFFDEHGRIELKTTGAYGVVRHPIYAAGSGFQLGAFLVTGHPAVFVAWAVFTLGALWFTRQEERRLVGLLDDPSEYDRYRQRVPALFPRIRRLRPRRYAR